MNPANIDITQLKTAIDTLEQTWSSTNKTNVRIFAQKCLDSINDPNITLSVEDAQNLESIAQTYDRILKKFTKGKLFTTSTTQTKIIELFKKIAEKRPANYQIYVDEGKKKITVQKKTHQTESALSGGTTRMSQLLNPNSAENSSEQIGTLTRIIGSQYYGQMRKYYKAKVEILNNKAEALTKEIQLIPINPQNLANYTNRAADLKKELQNLQGTDWRQSDRTRHAGQLSTIQSLIDEVTVKCLHNTALFLKEHSEAYTISYYLSLSPSKVRFDTSSIKKLYNLLPKEMSAYEISQTSILTQLKQDYHSTYEEFKNSLLMISGVPRDPETDQKIDREIKRYVLTQNLLRELDPTASEFQDARYSLTRNNLKKLIECGKKIYQISDQLNHPPLDMTEIQRENQLTKILEKLDRLAAAIPSNQNEDSPWKVLEEKIKQLKKTAAFNQTELSLHEELNLTQKYESTIDREIRSRHQQMVDRVCDIIYTPKEELLIESMHYFDFFSEPLLTDWNSHPQTKIWMRWIIEKTKKANPQIQRLIIQQNPNLALQGLLSNGIIQQENLQKLKTEFQQIIQRDTFTKIQEMIDQSEEINQEDLITEITRTFPNQNAEQLLDDVRKIRLSTLKLQRTKIALRERLMESFDNSEDFYDWKIESLLTSQLSDEEWGGIQDHLTEIFQINISREEYEEGLKKNGVRYVQLAEKAKSLKRSETPEKAKINAIGRQIRDLKKKYEKLFPQESLDSANAAAEETSSLSRDLRSTDFFSLIESACKASDEIKKFKNDHPESISLLSEIDSEKRTLIVSLQGQATKRQFLVTRETIVVTDSVALVLERLEVIAKQTPLANVETLNLYKENIKLVTIAKERYNDLLIRLEKGEAVQQSEIYITIRYYIKAYQRLTSVMNFVTANKNTEEVQFSLDQITTYVQQMRPMAANMQSDGQNNPLEGINISNLNRRQLQGVNASLNNAINICITWSKEKIEEMDFFDSATLGQKAITAQNLGNLARLESFKQQIESILQDPTKPIAIKKANLEEFKLNLYYAKNLVIPNLSSKTNETTICLRNVSGTYTEQEKETRTYDGVLSRYRVGKLQILTQSLETWTQEHLEIFSDTAPLAIVNSLTTENTVGCRKILLKLLFDRSNANEADQQVQEKKQALNALEKSLIENFLHLDYITLPPITDLIHDNLSTQALWTEWVEKEYAQIQKERALEGKSPLSDDFQAWDTWNTEHYQRITRGEDLENLSPPPINRQRTLEFLSDISQTESFTESKLMYRFQCYLLNNQLGVRVAEDQLTTSVDSLFFGGDWKAWAKERINARRRIQNASKDEKTLWESGGIQHLENISSFRTSPLNAHTQTTLGIAKRKWQIELEFITEQLIPLFDKTEQTKHFLEILVTKIKTLRAEDSTEITDLIDNAYLAILREKIEQKYPKKITEIIQREKKDRNAAVNFVLNHPNRTQDQEEKEIRAAAKKIQDANTLIAKITKMRQESAGNNPSFKDAVINIIIDKTNLILNESDEEIVKISLEILEFLTNIGITITFHQVLALLYQIQEYRRLSARAHIDVRADEISEKLTEFFSSDDARQLPSEGIFSSITQEEQSSLLQHHISREKAQQLLRDKGIPLIYPSWQAAAESINQSQIQPLAIAFRNEGV